ncbi:helix-turn-helix transcriptional regulator [Kitasatospora sp. NPDC101157]|uniref:helix-turn-helix transcriptional regulator n=1 Tax=Kitasatospora sp. NPDC101157 TaxID=3364098 RepID=UPI003820DB58
MTSAPRFAAWLKQAMRTAGLDVDSQRGGGRASLADACDVSRSTVGRWLDGASIPSPEHFKAIARTVGVSVADLLIGTGIMDQSDIGAPTTTSPAADLTAELGQRWGVPDDRLPLLRTSIEALAAGLAATKDQSAPNDGE